MTASTNPSPAEIVAALQRGGIVEALRLLLAARSNGAGATKRVAGRGGARIKPPASLPVSSTGADLSPGEVPRSNGDIWLLLVLGAALCAAYHFFGR